MGDTYTMGVDEMIEAARSIGADYRPYTLQEASWRQGKGGGAEAKGANRQKNNGRGQALIEFAISSVAFKISSACIWISLASVFPVVAAIFRASSFSMPRILQESESAFLSFLLVVHQRGYHTVDVLSDLHVFRDHVYDFRFDVRLWMEAGGGNRP